MNENPHIIIAYPNYYSKEFATDATKELEMEGLQLQIDETEQKYWACIEWAIPGLIVAFITKSYFESFLKEAGKDHYDILKKWLKKLIINTRKRKIITITNTDAIHKIDKSNTQSKAISIYLVTPDNKKIKLLFDESLQDDTWIDSLERIMNLILVSYQNTSTTNYIWNNTRSDYNASSLYAIINKETSEWIFLNDKDLARMHNEQIQDANNK